MTSTTPRWATVEEESPDTLATPEDWESQSSRIMSRKFARTSRGVGLGIISFFTLLWTLFFLIPRIHESLDQSGWNFHLFRNHTVDSTHSDQWQKPEDLRVVGLVFYGRVEYASILDCYLQVCLFSLRWH